MKIIVAGSRDFKDRERVYRNLDVVERSLEGGKTIEIVSGLARGPDTFGKDWAISKGYKVHEFPANWDKYGKKAGYLRNVEMSKVADCLIAFWNGSSPGTKHMIDIAHEHGLKVAVIIRS